MFVVARSVRYRVVVIHYDHGPVAMVLGRVIFVRAGGRQAHNRRLATALAVASENHRRKNL